MTLSFKQKFKNGSKTYFVEKILKGLEEKLSLDIKEYREGFNNRFNEDLELSKPPKIHTIREDKKNRWRRGNKIHFVVNNRTKNRFQFAPILEAQSIQIIEIRGALIYVDNKQLNESEINSLAINDGFKSVEDFFKWFQSDFTGKIIHWSNLKY